MKLENKEITIEYNKHDYGQVLRASGIFYVIKAPSFKTSISFLNYWKIKRNLDTTIIASLRKMDGTLISRKKLEFKNSNVINHILDIPDKFFEGSIEIEIFSLEDMVVPYAGIMVVYESQLGISLTHTYGRTYSNYEIEENKILSKGEETCCHAFVDSENTESFAVVHNGSVICPEQEIKISILNHDGKRQINSFILHELKPFETIKLRPQDCFPNLIQFLDGKPGYSSFSFNLNNSAFPRMLTINQKKDLSDFQVSHSNFNLSKHATPSLENEKFAYMSLPNIENTSEELIIYPDCGSGEFEIIVESGQRIPFNENKGAVIPIKALNKYFFTFEKLNDCIPSRIHTGIRLSKSSKRLSAETCLGVYHKQYSPKRFFWGICAANSRINSKIFLQQWDLGDSSKQKLPVIVKLYSDNSLENKEIIIDPKLLHNGQYISEIFPDAKDFLGSEYGWFTIFSEHPNYVVYSSLENNHDSITFEHGI
jgi:hypothetical protein